MGAGPCAVTNNGGGWMGTCCPVVELRQYGLHPGRREELISLFDREFVETQEAVGMSVIGQFRDLDDPDRFVWLRGFSDMASRSEALTAFYGGPVWAEHKDAANATMIDSDDVLLLRPAREGSGFPTADGDRPAPGAEGSPGGIVAATIYHLDAPAGEGFSRHFESALEPVLSGTGAETLAAFVTEESENTFAMLPVREDENVFVWFSLFRDPAAYGRHAAALQRSRAWGEGISGAPALEAGRPPEVLRLSPTARSLIRARPRALRARPSGASRTSGVD
ncbi:NIPSNAP family protein [Rubrobacter radiotolerans]|uniref:NIPSNAP family protein n=1 Tax=Rubrobacter radiotolerans TaxID=42256 RepID=UPI001E654E5D|nr:NIPSNAP family protein [Rubrobacter radiotolerans]